MSGRAECTGERIVSICASRSQGGRPPGSRIGRLAASWFAFRPLALVAFSSFLGLLIVSGIRGATRKSQKNLVLLAFVPFSAF